ncbi:MAG TPA: efflux RND transporter permease subunit, partial [Myxococcota bacterium]|nr:efflux RND transporter permease subunit [Myxococcota bacterium]
AAEKGASEIGFAIIAMTLTLISVFLPLAFVSDITGAVLREFAIALAAAVFFSGITALTLSPLMSAYLLKKEPKENAISLAIERGISKMDQGYYWLLGKLFAHRVIVYISLVVLLAVGAFLYTRLEHNLLPKEDRGLIGAEIPIIPGYDIDMMEPYRDQVERIFINQPEIERTLTFSFPRHIHIVSILKPWQKRHVHAEKIVERIRALVKEIPTATVHPWSWNIGLSALEEDGHENASIAVALKSAKSYEELEGIAHKLVEQLRKDNVLKDARSDLNLSHKAYSIEILREPLAALGIDEKAISIALQIFADRMRASEFKLESMRYGVYLQSNVDNDDLSQIYVSAKDGTQVPLATV